MIEMHPPQIRGDLPIWAEHDYACPVCRANKAVLNLNTDTFHACDHCHREGWRIVQLRGWVRRFLGWVFYA